MSQASFVGYGITGAVAALGAYVILFHAQVLLGAALLGGSILATIVLGRYHLKRAEEEEQNQRR